MFIEFQLNARAFLDAQLLTVQSQKLDFSQTLSFGSVTYAIDHIDFGANSLMQGDSQGIPIFYDTKDPRDYTLVMQKQLQLIQPITVYIVELSDVLAHPNASPAFFGTVKVNVHYTLQYQLTPLTGDALTSAVSTGDATSVDIFSIQYYYTEFLGVDPLPAGESTTNIQNWIDAYMAGHSPDINNVLGLVTHLFENNGQTLKNQPLPINTGMSIDPDLSRISFRQEAGGGVPGDPPNWQQYFNGVFVDRLEGASWAVYLDKNVLQEITENKIYDGLVENSSQFTLVSGVGSAYSNNGGTPTITSNFGGNVDTPICTIYTDVQIVAALSVDTPNTLTSDGHISWNAHTGACEITAAILGGAIGFGVDLIMPWLTSLINPITGAAAGVATVLYLKGNKQPDLPSMKDCTVVSDTELRCSTEFPAFTTPLGSLNFNSILAFDDGVSLQGALTVIPVGTAEVIFTITDALHWDAPSVPCSQLGPSTFQSIEANPQAYAQVSATISITAGDLAPVYIFYANPNGDALGLLNGHYSLAGSQAPAVLTVDIPYPGDAYYAAPYPIAFLIATSGGIRLVSLGTIPVFSQGAIDLMLAGVGAQFNRCKEKVVDQFQYYRKYVMRWAIDPYPGQKVFHSYGIAMRGVAAGERVMLAETNGRVLQTAYGREGEPLFLDAVMDPLSYQGLELVPERPGALDQIREIFAGGQVRSLDVTGQLMVTLAEVEVPAATEKIFASFNNGIPTLFVQTRSEVMGYDLSNPAIPRQYLSMASLAGERSAGEVRSRGSVFVRRDNMIEQFSVSGRQQPVLLRSHEMPGVAEILAPPVSQGTSLLVRFRDGKNVLYRFFTDKPPLVSIAYETEPWWLYTVTFNRLLIRLDKKTSTVSLNEYGRSGLL